MKITRRDLVGAGSTVAFVVGGRRSAELKAGVRWGAPWKRGEVRADETFALATAPGIPLTNASKDQAELCACMWSPDVPAMDLRHYDTRAHDLDSSYEDVQRDSARRMEWPGRAT